MATGWRRALEPLVGHLGVLGDDGRPTVHGAETPPQAPGLYFTGFVNPVTGMFRELGIDAKRIARAVASYARVGRSALRDPRRSVISRGAPCGRPGLAPVMWPGSTPDSIRLAVVAQKIRSSPGTSVIAWGRHAGDIAMSAASSPAAVASRFSLSIRRLPWAADRGRPRSPFAAPPGAAARDADRGAAISRNSRRSAARGAQAMGQLVARSRSAGRASGSPGTRWPSGGSITVSERTLSGARARRDQRHRATRTSA